MKVKVLQHHIDLGVRCSSTRCAIALAIIEQLGLGARDTVIVGWAMADIRRHRRWPHRDVTTEYRLDAAGRALVRAFDDGEGSPGEIELTEAGTWRS